MGTHPIFESDFDCLTEKFRMKLIGELKVPELHDELTRRGLSKKGKKQELIERLSEFLREQGNDPNHVDFAEPMNDGQSPDEPDRIGSDRIDQSTAVQGEELTSKNVEAADGTNVTEEDDSSLVRLTHVRETRNYRK